MEYYFNNESSYSFDESSFLNSTSHFDYIFDTQIVEAKYKHQINNNVKKQQKQRKTFSLIRTKVSLIKWFNSKKSDAKNNKRKSECNNNNKSKKSKLISRLMDKSIGWLTTTTTTTTTKKLNQRQDKNNLDQSHLNQNEIRDLNEKFYFHNSSYVLSAPSMCSSFDTTNTKREAKEANYNYIHSTPQSLFQQFSPIKQTSFISTPKLKRRLSLALTSSPVSLRNNNEMDHDDDDDVDFNDNSEIVDLRLLEHLNTIKKNIRINVVEKSTNNNNMSVDLSLIREKRLKLRKVFQSKLKRQLRDMKKWNLDLKSEKQSHKSQCFKCCNNNQNANYFYSNMNQFSYGPYVDPATACVIIPNITYQIMFNGLQRNNCFSTMTNQQAYF
ncbi:unnamed protein product [Brachionus calyciflorus]|uniref:Uncharacterized protein n=1 Tax=Brachionus calyciflorus TaxID=104777 RepID=A0A814DAP1_9BILA|nr:unnamed protein product [Brachionus calyciflorus]